MQKKNKKEIKNKKKRRLVNGKDKPEQDQKEKMKSHITDFYIYAIRKPKYHI